MRFSVEDNVRQGQDIVRSEEQVEVLERLGL